MKGMMRSCYKTLLSLRNQLGTHVEVSAKSEEPNNKIRTEQLSGLAISDRGRAEGACMDKVMDKTLREISMCRVLGTG